MTIRQTQCLLTYLGFDPGPVDGVDGPRTRGALAEFLAGSGGDPDAALLAAVAAYRRPESFWDGIRYFTRREFACPCPRCGGFPAEPAEQLVKIAEATRTAAGVPMHISSAVRCPAHNAEVGGVANSRHLSGRAMDFCLTGKTAAEALALVTKQPGIVYAYAIDGSFVHADIGGAP